MTGKKFSEDTVTMEEFTRVFYENLEAEEEAGPYQEERDIQSLIRAFSYGMPPCHPAQEDEGLFQEKSRMMDDDFAGSISGRAGEAEDDIFLIWETRQCTYPRGKKGKGEVCYIVCCTRDGIICKRAGEQEAIWKLSYRAEKDFGWVQAFFQKFPFGENLRFAVHKNFWQDFLSGHIDEKEFLDFFMWTENGIPYCLFATEESASVDRDGLKYLKYFSHHTMANSGMDSAGSAGELHLIHDGADRGWQEDYELWKRQLTELLRKSGRG